MHVLDMLGPAAAPFLLQTLVASQKFVPVASCSKSNHILAELTQDGALRNTPVFDANYFL